AGTSLLLRSPVARPPGFAGWSGPRSKLPVRFAARARPSPPRLLVLAAGLSCDSIANVCSALTPAEKEPVAQEIIMPRLSDSMEEGTVLQWLVAEGDRVAIGQPLVEIETDKATVTYEADTAGVVLALNVSEGATVPLGAPIAVIGAPGEELPAAESPEAVAAASSADAGPASS